MYGAKDIESRTGRARQPAALSDAALKRLFLWPTLGLLIAFNLFPLLYSLYLSFTDYSAISSRAPQWIGLQNYRDILNDGQLWIYFRNTGKYVVLSVAFETLVGFGMALLLRRKFFGSGIITTLILIPMMCSPVVVGLFWKMMYNPGYGIFNYLLGFPAGRGPDWLSSPKLALWAVVIVDVWMWAPYVMLLCLAGLSAIPDYLYEAAEIDRAGPLYTFWRITLPQVAPLLLIAVLFRTIEAFKTFDLVMGLTGGGPGDTTELVAVDLYRLAFLGQFNTGKSSALAYIVLVIITGVSNIYVRYLNKLKEG
ncbi:MAG TPA: sugar ABC transporter permease [Kouleothrix sp.]|mgnify:CR=1 FL=1|uniref:carbohydrate ABC transporter permease n=1 Tax=Kouleothrix sp. TaxID=2779161 RepID=UPI002CC4DCAA|nr:sugar ABC transporter permease [Kouleothrix sp.]